MSYCGKQGPIAFCPKCLGIQIFWNNQTDISYCLKCGWNNQKYPLVVKLVDAPD